MRKILLLGGSSQQVIAIKTAKRLGYYTILCDYLLDNPGQYVADKFYLISTTDKEAVLGIAEKEKIDGILAYASDPAAPTAAYIAEKMNLPGNPYESVQTLCNKDQFRKFLATNNFSTPKSNGYSFKKIALEEIGKFCLPVIVKPVDSSGSKGTSVLYSLENVEQSIDFAFSFSRSHRIIIEEFIEKKHPYLIGGDVFVIEGKIVLWGLMNCHRDKLANPLVPVGKSYPLKLSKVDVNRVKDTLQEIVDKLHIKNGALNVELIIDQSNRVWPIDIGPRCGGNMIPDLLGYIFNINVVEMSVKVAMGKSIDINNLNETLYYGTHNLHAIKNGCYKGIEFDPKLEKYIIKKYLYKKQGDNVEYFDNASKALGIIFMKFECQEDMENILENIHNYIHVDVE